MGTSVHPKPVEAGTRCMARTGVQDPPDTHLPQVDGTEQGTRWSACSLCCASATGCHCPLPLYCFPAPLQPCSLASSCPQPAKEGLGLMDVMEENTRNGFLPFRQRRKCHIARCTDARMEKGQGNRRREAVGQEVQHHPKDVARQMADLAAG